MSGFYDNYLSLCALHKKSPSAVAVAIGLSRTSPNGWKKGKQPTEVNLKKLANYFGVTVAELNGEEQKENPAATNGNEALEEKGYYKLNKENKKLIDQMIAQLIKSQSGD